jgi:hypothetical protein
MASQLCVSSLLRMSLPRTVLTECIQLVDSITAAIDVFRFGVDLSSVLALLSVIFVGNPVSLNPSYSIGGATSNVENLLDNLGGILGTPEGLEHSHNIIESDASLTRDDLYATGDAWTMNMDVFNNLYASIKGDALTRDEAAAFALKRYHNSIATNPYFWNGPVTNILMRPVGYVLVNDILSNHTDDNPDLTTCKFFPHAPQRALVSTSSYCRSSGPGYILQYRALTLPCPEFSQRGPQVFLRRHRARQRHPNLQRRTRAYPVQLVPARFSLHNPRL